MTIQNWITFIVFGFITWGCQTYSSPGASRPNILIILADDLGYSDLGCYGGEIQTPNVDALAEKGIRFTQFYNSARCCPSRASLLTGVYPHQAGIGSFVGKPRGVPGYQGKLTSSTVTIAELLKKAGYRTFGSGKWHVNDPGPIDRGFEAFYGFLEDYGVDGWESKWMELFPKDWSERSYEDGSFFATNAITDYALDFLDSARATPDQPWFLYLAYQTPHFPLQAPEDDIQKYASTYQVGWDSIRQQRYQKMLELGVIEPHEKLSNRSAFVIKEVADRNQVPGDGIHNPAWNLLEEDRQADLARRMAVYAGMVDNMDQNIGRMVADLRNNGELENTLILFLSDNGACGEWDAFGFEYPELNARVAGGTPGHPNVLHQGADLEKLGGPDGPLFSYGSGWANVGNTPFTLYKMFTYEGGISSPLIMHWPQKIKNAGIYKEKYGHIMDVMATCLDVADTNYPETFNGNKIISLEGISLFETLNSKDTLERLLVFEHSGYPAIRIGDWKLVARTKVMLKEDFHPDAAFELYHIGQDRAETKNLISAFPEKAEEMKNQMLEEFKRIKVFPRP